VNGRNAMVSAAGTRPVPALDRYEQENLLQPSAEHDTFTVERYQQFARHSSGAATVLDVGCSTGRGGAEYVRLRPTAELWGIDVVQERLDALPDVYGRRIRGLSTDIPLDAQQVDLILAGEFLEHLTPADVDPTLCEFQRVLKVGGRLLLTTPNPRYIRLALTGGSVYGPGHLTQHYPRLLRTRLMMHGFKRVRIRGSGRISRYAGERFPLQAIYGSYLISADKR
jgi:ubiquinone/menaquinone biosynthesis C-methylase UbiE